VKCIGCWPCVKKITVSNLVRHVFFTRLFLIEIPVIVTGATRLNACADALCDALGL